VGNYEAEATRRDWRNQWSSAIRVGITGRDPGSESPIRTKNKLGIPGSVQIRIRPFGGICFVTSCFVAPNPNRPHNAKGRASRIGHAGGYFGSPIVRFHEWGEIGYHKWLTPGVRPM